MLPVENGAINLAYTNLSGLPHSTKNPGKNPDD